MVANLVGNAIDALPEGGRIIVRAACSRNWRDDTEGVVITVADDGIGMEAETRKRVFEPFFFDEGNYGDGAGALDFVRDCGETSGFAKSALAQAHQR